MDNISTLILGISLMIIMLGMGLSLTLADFGRVLKQPKAVLIGLVNQLVFLPLIGYTICVLLNFPPPIAIGVMILVACPGGATSNLITHLAKGDTALSVTLTAITSMVTIVTIPLIVQFALGEFQGEGKLIVLDVPDVIKKLAMIILVPISLGMIIKARANTFAQKMDSPVKIASAVLLGVIILGIIIKERANVPTYFQVAGLPTLLLNVVTMGLGFLTATLFKLGRKQAISISVESGIQNGTLALAIATVTLASPEYGIPAAIYSLIMFATGGLAIFYGRRSIS